MTSRGRIVRNSAIGLVLFLLGLVFTLVIVVQTDWFRNYVRQKIVSAVEESTGGTAEIGSFRFDPLSLKAVIDNFVLHGNEPRGSEPFVRVARLEVDVRLLSSLQQLVSIAYVGVQKPAVNIISLPNGETNIPSPKQKTNSDKTGLETVVDLAIGQFDLADGFVAVNQAKQQLNIKANNLRAQLFYNVLSRSYQGALGMEPLYVMSGRNTPVNFRVQLPVVLQRDRIELRDASISTPFSQLHINGALENLRNPKTSAHINGHLALADLKNAGNLPLELQARNVPSSVDVDANATLAENAIQVTGLRLGIGQSNVEASGTLKDPQGNGSLQFKTQLALGELGRLAGISAKPDGTVVLNGNAKLDAKNNYDVTGNLEGRNISVQQGAQKIGGINVLSAVHVSPQEIAANGLRLSAFGGEFAGNASLENMDRYKLDGTVRNLDIQTAARTFGVKKLPYDGVISGPVQAQGSTKVEGTKSIVANARLLIAPGRRGIPVSGRLNADYNGASDNVVIEKSFLALPHTRLDVSGSLKKQLSLDLQTRDLNDLLAAASLSGSPQAGPPPVVLNGGQASFKGTVTGALGAPRVSGHLAMDRFSVEGRAFQALNADVAAASNQASISNASLTRGAMEARFSASLGLRNWSPQPKSPLTADVAVRNGDLADVMVLAGQPAKGYSGALTAEAHVNGTFGNPRGTATLQAANGTVQDEPFQRVNAKVNLADQMVTVPAASIVTPAGHVDLTAEFQHPRDSFATGRLHAHVQSGTLDLAKLRTLQQAKPNTGGTATLNADLTGEMGKEFEIRSVNADASAKGLRFEGQNYGDVNATARTNGQTVAYNVASNFAGSNIRVNGKTELVKNYPTVADATLASLPLERLLTLAGQGDIPARGSLSGTAHVDGSLANPQGRVDLDLANAVVYDEPLDHVRARATYLSNSIDVPLFEIVEGSSKIDLTGRFDHPANSFDSGTLRFQVNSTPIDFAKVRNIQKARPGLGGVLKITASGAATLKAPPPNAKPTAEPSLAGRLLFSALNVDVGATGMRAQGKNMGDLTLTASTTAGRLNFALDSNLAGSSIQGRGNAALSGNYPVSARIAFNNVAYTRIQALLGPTTGTAPAFEATTDGSVDLSGSMLDPSQMSGRLQLSKAQLTTTPATGGGRPLTIQNSGPIAVALDRGVVRIESAHITGPDTDISAGGTANLQTMALNLTLNANANLAVLQNIDRDIYSSGKVVLATTVRGTASKPLINGQMTLQNASMNYASLPNGLSNANGQIVFNGNSATIRNLTAESGGGKITMGGFVGFADAIRFGVRAQASSVRIRVQPGVSVALSSNVRLTGTTQGSLVSGDVTVDRITYAPQSDFGSLLSRAAPPVQTPTTPSPLLDNMKLDVRVRTSPALAVQASLAQNLQADADLRVRGTASEPAVLGRVTINEGQLVFFGSTYTVNSGSISFYNPVRIEPVLNISLETQAKGVDVVLTVTGPIDNMKLSYTSDPPLQFQEIVQLLASGKTPTSDPTLLANQPTQPQQSYQQMGESAIVGKALADPVSNRLQRVFGVTQLKIDPAFTSGSQLPTAQLTLQQQVSSNITFTYTSALSDPNSTIVRVEWSFNPQFSAVATRDQNGIFSLNFFYKKQFR